MNSVTLTGSIKNVKTIERDNWKIITANFSQYGEIGNNKSGCIVTFPVVFTQSNLDQASKLTPNTDGVVENVKITGRLITNFDRRKGVENADRRKPWTQIEVTELVLN